MEAVDRFRIKPIPEDILRSQLILDETSSLEVDGQAIEAQFRCSRGYLVITSDGNPYEEMIHFYLLDHKGDLLDEVSLGRIYHSGTLRDIDAKSDDQVEFSFFGTERWCLSILAEARLQPAPLFSSVTRKQGWLGSHYLSLRKCS